MTKKNKGFLKNRKPKRLTVNRLNRLTERVAGIIGECAAKTLDLIAEYGNINHDITNR